jgi:hypothetical protein
MLDWLSPTSRLRPVLTLLGLIGLSTLAACGGGSGAPNNPYNTPPTTAPLAVQPATVTAYSGVPVTLQVTSGVAPFVAFSSNATVLPVPQSVAGDTIVLVPNKVTADTDVDITVEDSIAQTAHVKVTVTAAPIFNAFTFVPSGGDCGTNLCSGQSGVATVVATAPGGAPLVARPIKFDVIFGPVGFTSSNPATPVVISLTVATDSSGTAVARVQAPADATTQPAQIRATDVTSGQFQIANFTVVNNNVAGQSPLTVVPPTATITSALSTFCSTGFRIDYYVFGGNPPYTVSSTFPDKVILANTTVQFSGGFFEAITNGGCVNPLTFTISDSAGKQTTATLNNVPGTGTPPAPATLAISPSSVTGGNCTGKTFNLVITGGTHDYNVTTNPAGAVATPQVVTTSGGTTAISSLPSGVTTVTVVDSGAPQQVVTATITCS